MNRRILPFALAFLIALPALAITRTWTGVESNRWSNPANWSPQGIPAPADSLRFPAIAPLNMNNDLPAGTVVGPMSFEGDTVLNGNPLTLTGNLSFTSSPEAISFVSNVDLTLGASITFYGSIGHTYNGALDVNGKTLTFNPAYATVIRGPIRGTGKVLIIGTGLNVVGSGSFSGTIDGRVNVVGSYPNATIRSARFSGNGTVGPVTAGLLYPGDAPPTPSSGSEPAIGTIQTGSLAITPAGAAENGANNSNPKGRYLIEVQASGVSDQLRVRGTVTLDATLEILVRSVPANGQSFEIIDNDGADPVSGTFTGLSEGAIFTVGSTTFSITYAGGDGNDVVLNVGTPQPTTKTWTGATSANWSDASNWSPAGAPVSGDALLFPAGARLQTTNDLSGFVAGPLTFNDDYTLSGNALTLKGDLQFGGSSVDFVCNAPLLVRASIRIQQAGSARFTGAIDLASNNVTITTRRTSISGAISGTGEILAQGEGLSVSGDGPFGGRFRGRLDLTGNYPNATIDGLLGTTTGAGSSAAIAATTLSPGTSDPCCADAHRIGVLETKWLSIIDKYAVDLAPNGSDRVRVDGPVSLYGLLDVNLTGEVTSERPITIIDGNQAISGTFRGLPEGSILYAGDAKFRITYVGGDGYDVVLTRVAAEKFTTTISLTQDVESSQTGTDVTFTARVVSTNGTPSGTVTFVDGGITIGTSVLQNGVAELMTSSLLEGTHTIVATYGGSETHAPSASAPIAHERIPAGASRRRAMR